MNRKKQSMGSVTPTAKSAGPGTSPEYDRAGEFSCIEFHFH